MQPDCLKGRVVFWNCQWGHALKRSPGIIRKSRVLYPSPGFLSSAIWPSLPKKHYNGLINQSTRRVLLLADYELESLQQSARKMQSIFETQEYSQADVERFNQDRQELQRQIDALQRENDNLDKDIWNHEMDIAKGYERVCMDIGCR